jgi:undecaprenyl diphosphate synthase
MKNINEHISPDNVPQHIAIIMDGNGRWAKQQHKPRIFGHKNALTAVRETVEAAAELGVKYLTLYAFSTENWNRPKLEVDALMELLVHAISSETKTLNKNGIKLTTIGNTDMLPKKCLDELNTSIETTSKNERMTLVLALSYSAKWEIVNAVKKIAQKVKNKEVNIEDIDDKLFSQHLSTSEIPDPELMIRTSGEFRISNFLLWQIAYSELYFTPVLWPDFRKKHLLEAVYNYQQRERRFGLTEEQKLKIST